MKLVSFATFLKEQVTPITTNTQKQKMINNAPKNKWENLIDSSKLSFDNNMQQKDLTDDDKNFIAELYDHYKGVKQLRSNVFTFKTRGVLFKVGFFKNRKWAASIQTNKIREVTEKFQVTDVKIQGLIQLFDKAIKQQTFKDVLPIVTK